MNAETQIWELFYAGLTPNAMFMVAMVLLTWLGFRFAAAISNDSNTPMMAIIGVLESLLIAAANLNPNQVSKTIATINMAFGVRPA